MRGINTSAHKVESVPRISANASAKKCWQCIFIGLYVVYLIGGRFKEKSGGGLLWEALALQERVHGCGDAVHSSFRQARHVNQNSVLDSLLVCVAEDHRAEQVVFISFAIVVVHWEH